jgi:hypothetical protein
LPSQPEQAEGSRRPLWVFEVDQHPALRDKLAALMVEVFTAVLPSTLQETQNRNTAANPEAEGEFGSFVLCQRFSFAHQTYIDFKATFCFYDCIQ